jgi:hypothetical protein
VALAEKSRSAPALLGLSPTTTTLSIPEIPEAIATVNTESHASSVNEGVEIFKKQLDFFRNLLN